MVAVVKPPWEALVQAVGTDQLWPLAAMTPGTLYKWLMAVKDLRLEGNIDVVVSAVPANIVFDFALSDAPGYVPPTELSHVTVPGLRAECGIAVDGSPVLRTDPGAVAVFTIEIGQDGAAALRNPRYDSGNVYLPLFVRASNYTDGGESINSSNFSGTAATFDVTFDGETVPMYIETSGSPAGGELNITLPVTGGWLTFGGKRNADTGHFTTTTV